MILSSRETCIAYRCPYCGTGVKSMVGVFSLSGAVKKLKCDCGSSELKITQLRDGKLRISAPCFFCMTEHSFVISSKLFFDKELFVYPCPYSAIDIIFIGTPEAVSVALDKSEQEIIKMLRDTGAKEVHVRVCSPIVKHPCHLGIDIQTYSQLIGAYRDENEISRCIGADSVRYLSVEHLVESCKKSNLKFCLGCFTGKYPYPMETYETDKFKFE